MFKSLLVPRRCLLLAAAVLCSGAAAVAQPLIASRPFDQIDVANTRRLSSQFAPLSSVRYQRRLGPGRFQTLDAGTAGQDLDGIPRTTIVYVHGNRIESDEAYSRGLETYRQLLRGAVAAPPIRFVIWTWPADQIPGPFRDVRVKASRADEHAFHLARFLNSLPPGVRVGVIGFSYGGRQAIGAMHLLGGGTINRRGIETFGKAGRDISLTVLAPAIRNDCFSCTRTKALNVVDRLFVLYNTGDPALRLFRFLRFDEKRPALGLTGVAGRIDRSQLRQYDARQLVGPRHDYVRYIDDPRVDRLLRENLQLVP